MASLIYPLSLIYVMFISLYYIYMYDTHADHEDHLRAWVITSV